jgi:hypothetical protein
VCPHLWPSPSLVRDLAHVFPEPFPPSPCHAFPGRHGLPGGIGIVADGSVHRPYPSPLRSLLSHRSTDSSSKSACPCPLPLPGTVYYSRGYAIRGRPVTLSRTFPLKLVRPALSDTPASGRGIAMVTLEDVPPVPEERQSSFPTPSGACCNRRNTPWDDRTGDVSREAVATLPHPLSQFWN